uniref:Uncharacterized protein n=1 Tax=Anguilla anguilla TaxID=7936 RepID=A0A0E9Q9V7_ANGAN
MSSMLNKQKQLY